MYVEADFLLALIKDEDWLSEAAEKVYHDKRDELWTRAYTLIELMLVSYREDRNVLKTINSASRLVEIRGNEKGIKEAASYVTNDGMTPFDGIHLAFSGNEKIVSSDREYDGYTERLKLEERGGAN